MVSKGNEYYALPKYAQDKNHSEIYAQNSNNDEFYRQQQDGTEIFALKKNSKNQLMPVFAVTSQNIPICPILEVGQKFLKKDIAYPKIKNKEIYPQRNNRQYYIMKNNVCVYARTALLDEYFALNENQKPYYGARLTKEGHLIEFPASDHDKQKIYIENGETIQYPYDELSQRPIYPELNGNETYLEKNNVQIYAKNRQNLPVYAKKANGDDILALKGGEPYYAFYDSDTDRIEYYPKLNTRRQFYLRSGKTKIYAKRNSDEIYAKTEIRDDILAQIDTVPYYATKMNNTEEYYPCLSSGKNFYMLVDNKERIAVNKTTNEGFYASDDTGNQFYPKDFNLTENPDAGKVDLPAIIREPTLEEILKHEA